MFDNQLTSGSETRTLFYIYDHKACSPSEMAKKFGLTRSTITEQIHHLEKSGLINYIDSPTDKRTKVVSLTEDGVKLVKENISKADAFESQLASQLTDQEIQSIHSIHDKIVGLYKNKEN